MVRYLKIGGLALAVLVAGFLLGSGSIGDIIRSWMAGTSASAEGAEVEEAQRSLANEYVDTLGQPLGEGSQQISFDTAFRCWVIAKHYDNGGPSSEFVTLTPDQTLTILGNARGIVYSQNQQRGMDQLAIGKESMLMTQSLIWADRNRLPEKWEREARALAIEFENLCSPLLGRRARSQNGEQ